MHIDDVKTENNEIRFNCTCGKSTWMEHKDFMALVISGRKEGLRCDYCNGYLANVIVCPTLEA